MKSFYAVATQIIFSGSNYLVFLLLFKYLPTDQFIGFSTAVGLNMIAYAIADGGISYVAPRDLSIQTEKRKSISSSFLLISASLYLVSLIAGFFIWNLISSDNLSFRWVTAYALFFIPALLLPPWLTCWAIGLKEVIVIGTVRALAILVVFLSPDSVTLTLTGLAFLLFTIATIVWLNRKVSIIGIPDWPELKYALRSLYEVFLSKSSSYAVYSTTPMVVSAIYGSYTASLYIAGERIKSMYSAMFHPVVQALYLSGFQTKVSRRKRNKMVIAVVAINLMAALLLILTIQTGLLNAISDRFSNIQNLWIYVVAAFLSVVTSVFLFFVVLSDGNYKIFRKATYFQLGSFIALFIIMGIFPVLSPEYVLLTGEFAILAAIIFQLGIHRESPNPLSSLSA